MSEQRIDNLDRLRLEPVCRLACTLLGAPAATISLAGSTVRWSHGVEAMAASFRTNISFGPDDIGTLTVLDRAPRSLTPEETAHMGDLAQMAGQLLAQHLDGNSFAQQLGFYRMLAEASTETIVRGTLDGVRLYVSPSIRELLGYEPEELIGHRAVELTHPDDLDAFRAIMQEMREGRFDKATHELRQRHKDGSWVWMEASLRLTRDKRTNLPDGYVVSVRGIGQRKELEAWLERRAGYDDLSGLPNRALFRKILAERLAAGRPLTLLYMDLDDFKVVNDRFGHATGDAVLQQFAARLQAEMRDSDIIARLGGDEFTAIVESRKGIASLCKRLIAAAAAPFPVGDTEIRIGLSIGVASAAGGEESLDALLSRADHALYDAKNVGKNRYRLAMVA